MAFIQNKIGNWAILGRLGSIGKRKREICQELQQKFGEGAWQVAHLVQGALLTNDQLFKHFEESYYNYFLKNPEILDWLCQTAKEIYSTNHLENDLDQNDFIAKIDDTQIQLLAIKKALKRLNREFQGERLIQIQGEASEGFFLSTSQIPFYNPSIIIAPQIKGNWEKNSIEAFYQSNRVLAIQLGKLQSLVGNIVGIILRSDLSMGKGKFATQAAHVAVTLIPERGLKWDQNHTPIEIWTLNCEERLESLYKNVSKLNFNCCLIRDAGKTQLSPGTKTAMGIGPINQVIFDSLMCDCEAIPIEPRERSYRLFKSFNLLNL